MILEVNRGKDASGDIINTLGGGVCQPMITSIDDEHGRTIHVRVPGVSGRSLEVEVNNNLLTVFYPMTFSSWGKPVSVPRIILSRPIPYFVYVEGISAVLHDNTLQIRLPFNARANGYRRRVRISGT